MEIIIDFFRGIDGWPYYTILVVNTILIFAIIGYLGDKNNEQLIKMGMDTKTPELKNGAMNLTPVHSASVQKEATIPQVSPTQITNSQVVTNNVAVPSENKNVNNTIPIINQNASAQVNSINNEIDPNEKAPSVLVINSSDINKDAK